MTSQFRVPSGRSPPVNINSPNSYLNGVRINRNPVIIPDLNASQLHIIVQTSPFLYLAQVISKELGFKQNSLQIPLFCLW